MYIYIYKINSIAYILSEYNSFECVVIKIIIPIKSHLKFYKTKKRCCDKLYR